MNSWGTYHTFDMLSVALLPSGLTVSAALSTADGSSSVSFLGANGPACSTAQNPLAVFPARFGLHSPDGASYAEVEAVWLAGYEIRVEVAGLGEDVAVLVTVVSVPPTVAAEPGAAPPPLVVNVTAGTPPSWAPRTCSSLAAPGPALLGTCPGFEDVLVWPSTEDAPFAAWFPRAFQLPIAGAVGAQVAWATGAAARSLPSIAAAVTAARAALVNGYLDRAGPANNETLAGMGAVMGWNAAYGPRQGIVAPISRGNFWNMVRGI